MSQNKSNAVQKVVAIGVIAYILWKLFKKEEVSAGTKEVESRRIGGAVSEIRRNPGAIFHNPANQWTGLDTKNSKTGEVAYFASAEYGVRAQLKLLYSYYHNKNLKTIRQILGRWTGNEIVGDGEQRTQQEEFICSIMGVDHNTVLHSAQLVPFAFAEHQLEAGYEWLSLEYYQQVNDTYSIFSMPL
jgi:hypothetical protein